jgi:hypothetical protein
MRVGREEAERQPLDEERLVSVPALWDNVMATCVVGVPAVATITAPLNTGGNIVAAEPLVIAGGFTSPPANEAMHHLTKAVQRT